METEPEMEYIQVYATDLLNAFESNPVQCRNTYHNKMIEVTGRVSKIGIEDFSHKVYIEFSPEWGIPMITCYAKDEEQENQISELSEGQTVTIRGLASCDGDVQFVVNDAEIY